MVRKVAACASNDSATAISAARNRIGLPQVGQRRHHFVAGRDHLAVHLVGALCGDQVGDFGHHVDVGCFNESLHDGPEAGLPVTGAPDAAVCMNRLPPCASSPASLGNTASWICPTVCGAVWPCSVTCTWPEV